MAGHGGNRDDDDTSAPAASSAADRDGLDVSARSVDAQASGAGGGDARPISLLGLRLTEPPSPRNALVTRRPTRTRPGVPRVEPGSGVVGGPTGGVPA
ncbi:hypothetical protein ND748_26510, partial [Frankia sp. AiPs1]|nr:hypothetical protein [Frankia sp. AiPs1]